MIKKVSGEYQVISSKGKESWRTLQDARCRKEAIAASGVLQASQTLAEGNRSRRLVQEGR